MKSNALSLLLVYCALLISVSPHTFGDTDPPCPDWKEVFGRTGSDGGRLIISFDLCQVFGYEIYSMPQFNGEGMTAELIPNDLIVVWDEDAGHGVLEEYKNFSFTGTYVPDPNNGSVSLTTTDGRTNWNIYRVTESGFFTKGKSGTNEHEVIHFYDMLLQKMDDVNDLTCRFPGQSITYTINYKNISDQTLEDVVLIDWLPQGVTYPPGEQDPNYNSVDHFYLWQLGTVEPNDIGYVNLTVVVNEESNPTGLLHNVAELWSPEVPLSRAVQDTKVCCWGGAVVYVDQNASGQDTGTSWLHAYSDLQGALTRVSKGCGNTIYLADGLYKPGLDTASSFEIPDGVSVYGGFGGYGSDPNDRNRNQHRTILNGYIGQNDYGSNLYSNTVIRLADNTLLDGVTVEQGNRGIDVNGGTALVQNCIVKNNIGRGVYVENGDLTVRWTDISSNGFQGIHHLSDANSLTIENCRIYGNRYDGIRTVSSVVTVLNSLIYQNGADSGTHPYYGIHMLNSSAPAFLRNNTIVQNVKAGLHFSGTCPPEILNSIIYYNGGSQINGINTDQYAFSSCIADCNDVNGNFSDPPGFAYMIDPNTPVAGNYHLAYDAVCVDAGEGDFYPGETDMDGEPRVYGSRIDVGADEAYACDDQLSEDDIYHPLDWNMDGVINFDEFSRFSAAWLSHDPNDPVSDPNHFDYVSDPNHPGYISPAQKANWNPLVNIVHDIPGTIHSIDLYDFEVLCNHWAWTACWKRHQIEALDMPPALADDDVIRSGISR